MTDKTITPSAERLTELRAEHDRYHETGMCYGDSHADFMAAIAKAEANAAVAPAKDHATPEAIQQIMWAIFSYADRREAMEKAPPGEPRQIAHAALMVQDEYIRGLLRQLASPSATALSDEDATNPETPGTWEERCAALYQVVGCLAHMAGIFGVSDDVGDALDVAAGRGNVFDLLPWPKDTELFKRVEQHNEGKWEKNDAVGSNGKDHRG